jgi:hypothetical protein
MGSLGWSLVDPMGTHCHRDSGHLLGSSGKTLHPRNVGFTEIHEISFQAMSANDSQVWLLHVNLLSISGWLKPAKSWSRESSKVWNHEPAKPWSRESAKIRNHEYAKIWSREPATIWSHGPAKFRNLVKFKFGGYDVWRSPCTRDSETSKKPSQRRCLKSLGLTCELVADL